MLRIVGVQRSDDVNDEFVILQNQGSLRVCLKGHALIPEAALEDLAFEEAAFIKDDVYLHPGLYAIIRSGDGINRWCKSKDGAPIYQAFLHRAAPVWSRWEGHLLLLAMQHRFCERSTRATLR